VSPAASWVQGDWLAARARLSPERIALEIAKDGRTITYAAWNEIANRTARWLETQGVGKGDRVAVLSKNRLEILDLWFACGKLGAILQTLNFRLTVHELAQLLDPAPPSLLLYGPDTAQTAEKLSAGARLDFEAMQARGELSGAAFEATPVTADDPWVICYTGGSTGIPKGALLTHGSILANAVNTVASWQLAATDVAILNAPLFHVGGLSVLTAPLVLAGGRSILCDGFDAGEVLSLCETGGVTAFFGVPTMFLALLEHPRFETADLSGLKLVISGGAPCPEAIFERMQRRGVPFKQGYGLTEAGPNTFWLPDSMAAQKVGSVGFPLFGIDTRVVDESGASVGPGVAGELLIRGAHVFGGYFGLPAETEKALRGGWLQTGDLAVVDEDGAYRIVGRSKDVIISGGENVYPAEIEGVLSMHPAVAEVCVIGVPHARWGEVGRAVVVTRGEADSEALLAYARNRLAKFKVPKDVVYTESLPRTGAGKVDRRAIAETFGQGSSS